MVGGGASVENFSKFYKDHDGSTTAKVCKETTEDQEKAFFEKSLALGPGFGPSCSKKVSSVVGNSKGFPNVKPGTFFPGTLFKDAGK